MTKKKSKKCYYNNRGYCKAKEECVHKHSDKVCEDLDCIEVKGAVEEKVHKENNFMCSECDFITNSRQGLKIHKSKTHSKINFEEFPAACNICEKVLDNEVNLKKHKKSEHTFHVVKFQYDECDFMANEVETLHVHFGLHHSEKGVWPK